MASEIYKSVVLCTVKQDCVDTVVGHVTDVYDIFQLVHSLQGEHSNVYES